MVMQEVLKKQEVYSYRGRRSVGYIRVSTHGQAEGDRYSLPAQEEDTKQEILDDGGVLLEIIQDEKSAKDMGRPGFAKLLEMLEGDEIDRVYCSEVDRFSRDLEDTLRITKKYTARDIHFIFFKDHLNTAAPDFYENQELLFHLKSTFSHYFRRQLARKVKRGLSKRASEGLHCGKSALGYVMADKKQVINEQEARIIKRVFDLLTNDHLSFKAIADRLNGEGVRTRSGALFEGTRIRRILTNKVYIGLEEREGEDYQGQHKPIIEGDQWERAQEIVMKRSMLHPRTRTASTPFAGLIRCGSCKKRMRVHIITGALKNGESFTKNNFRCSSRGRSSYHCEGPVTKSQNLLEATILDVVKKLCEYPEYLQEKEEQFLIACRAEGRQAKEEIKLLDSQIRGIEIKLGKLLEVLYKGNKLETITAEMKRLEEQKVIWDERRKELASSLLSEGRMSSQYERFKVALAIPFSDFWQEATLEEKRAFLCNILEEVTAFKTYAEIKPVFLPPITTPYVKKAKKKCICRD